MIECIGLKGDETRPYLEDLAKLRCEVFREYPYLYEGDVAYEREYLARYAETARAYLVLARFRNQIVGVSTCMAMEEADPAFQAPFTREGYDLRHICYFGESVLLPEFRGHGVGKRFFDLRENWALTNRLPVQTFCSVLRQEHHPFQPDGYRPHDAFWKKRGFVRHDHLIAELDWPEIGCGPGISVQHQLVFWLKSPSHQPHP